MSAMKPIHVQQYDRRNGGRHYQDSKHRAELFLCSGICLILGMAIMRGWMAL